MKLCMYFALLLLFSSASFAQNLSGVWEGKSNMGSVRLVIIHQGDSCFGYVYENSFGSCTAHFEGRFDVSKKELKGVSPGFIKKSFGHGLARYSFTYDSTGPTERLNGKAKPKTTAAQILSFGKSFHCELYRTYRTPDTTAFMTARLSRQSSTIAALHPLPDQLAVRGTSPIPDKVSTIAALHPLPDQPVLPVPDSAVRKMEPRETEVLHAINAAEGVVQCTLYDNGVYDHDTVTVLHNNNIIINRAEISGKPLVFSIRLSKQQPLHEIIFYANNLGDIPPNTGLLLIETGDKRFSLPLKADLSRNGKIIIRLTE